MVRIIRDLFNAATREPDRNISNTMTSPLIITRRPTAAPAGKSAHNMSPAREAMEREASDEKLNMDGAFSAKQPVIPCKQNTTV